MPTHKLVLALAINNIVRNSHFTAIVTITTVNEKENCVQTREFIFRKEFR